MDRQGEAEEEDSDWFGLGGMDGELMMPIEIMRLTTYYALVHVHVHLPSSPSLMRAEYSLYIISQQRAEKVACRKPISEISLHQNLSLS